MWGCLVDRLVVWTRACTVDELQEAAVTPLRVGTTALVAVRAGDDVHVFDALCPHKFGPLSEGHVEDGCLHCPVHDAAFHLESGHPREGEGWAGTLRRYPARIVGTDVEVSLD